MRIKKFIAKTMREALLQIKEELGEDAVILKTRKLPKKVLSLGAQDEVEVTAAIDEGVQNPTVHPLHFTGTGVYSKPRRRSDTTSFPIIQANTPQIDTPQPNRDTRDVPTKFEYLEIKENIRELRSLIANVLENGEPTGITGGFTGGWAILYKRLLESEVKPEVADRLIKAIATTDFLSSDHVEKRLIATLSDHFPVSGPMKLKKEEPVIVAFVGPTGAGKTTTLAKLAAYCCLHKNKKVSIITADTYRIAAIEQIRMFADIVKLGLNVVFSPEEIPNTLKKCAEDDIIFVDTAGRSQRNKEHMDELTLLIEKLRPHETHLVVSATTKDSDLFDTIDRYKPIGINRLLFSKLDETVRLGNIFNVVNQSNIPVSYFTFGQNVPDDIELARSSRFVQQLWYGSTR